MNVHPGGSPDVLARAIEETVLPLRARLGARGPFGLALRLDAQGVRALADDLLALGALRARLARHDLVPFTANGFVLGRFHGAGVKDAVYRPTWREAEREDYTVALAGVLAALRGPGEVVSISTAPGSWRGWGGDPRAAGARARAPLHAREHGGGAGVLPGAAVGRVRQRPRRAAPPGRVLRRVPPGRGLRGHGRQPRGPQGRARADREGAGLLCA